MNSYTGQFEWAIGLTRVGLWVGVGLGAGNEAGLSHCWQRTLEKPKMGWGRLVQAAYDKKMGKMRNRLTTVFPFANSFSILKTYLNPN
jgi:hypothetical protein